MHYYRLYIITSPNSILSSLYQVFGYLPSQAKWALLQLMHALGTWVLLVLFTVVALLAFAILVSSTLELVGGGGVVVAI